MTIRLATLLCALAITGCNKPSMEEIAWEDSTVMDASKMKALLANGLNPNLETAGPGYKDFLLYRACKYRQPNTVRVLLEHGADPNKRTWGFGKTCLFQAAYDGRLDIASLLLDAGADVNAVDDSGNNALREAALNGKIEAAVFLLSKGLSPQQRNKQGLTMLDVVAKYAKPKVAAAINEIVEPQRRANPPPPAAPESGSR